MKTRFLPALAALPLLSASAMGAADPGEYPWSAKVQVPASAADAPLRVDLSGAWLARCPDPTSYLLLDGDGQEVPFATFTSDGNGQGGDNPSRRDLRWAPDEDKDGSFYRLPALSGTPAASGLYIRLPRHSVARVRVHDLSAPDRPQLDQLVWNLPDTSAGASTEITFPWGNSSGPWEVRVSRRSGLPLFARWPDLEFQAILAQPQIVPEVQIPISTEGPVPLDSTTSQWALALPRGDLPVRSLTLAVDDTLYSRPATLRAATLDGARGSTLASGLLQRFERNDFTLESAALDFVATAPRSLVLEVEDGRSAPLALQGATLGLRGAALWLPQARPGELSLMGCGPTGADYDIDRAARRHGAWDGTVVFPEEPAVSPGWRDRLLASLGELGPAPGPVDFTHARDVVAEPGLIRLALDAEIMAAARDDLGDLRILGSDERQVAYLLERHPTGHTWQPRVSEELIGSRTRFSISLPAGNLRVQALVLSTDRGRFHREVALRPAVAAGQDEPAPLLTRTWVEDEGGPARLYVPIDRRLPREIWVDVEHGDNAPIPLHSPAMVLPSATLWAVVPAGDQFRLFYGADSLAPPQYDLAFLRGQLLESPATEAHLGAAEVLAAATRPVQDKTLLLIAIGGMALALLLLIGRLVAKSEDPPAT